MRQRQDKDKDKGKDKINKKKQPVSYSAFAIRNILREMHDTLKSIESLLKASEVRQIANAEQSKKFLDISQSFMGQKFQDTEDAKELKATIQKALGPNPDQTMKELLEMGKDLMKTGDRMLDEADRDRASFRPTRIERRKYDEEDKEVGGVELAKEYDPYEEGGHFDPENDEAKDDIA